MADVRRLLIVAEEADEKREDKLQARVNRVRAMKEVQASGKVRHDSGGRLLVIDSYDDDRILESLPPGSRIVSIDERLADSMSDLAIDLDSSESLFLEALQIRSSERFREAKARQKPGETPEEQLMFTTPCTGA